MVKTQTWVPDVGGYVISEQPYDALGRQANRYS
jgi:hypothetical protein